MSELLKINVNEHTEKKNGLTYLSWAWAWAEVLKIDPDAVWYASEYGPQGCEVPFMRLPDESCMVRVGVTIKGHHKSCMLPVMNHRNQAIKNPDAFQVNTAIMRCLAKAISMHGLGLYIYAGEDLPEEDQTKKTERENTAQEIAYEIATAGENGQELKAANIFYAIEDNEVKLEVWGMLKQHSALRASIKRNNPHKEAA